jgi:hypothetical protein
MKIKFKRGATPLVAILGQAYNLGLSNEPSFVGADCCFVKNGWISFGQIGSNAWNNADIAEISEDDFMALTTLKDDS